MLEFSEVQKETNTVKIFTANDEIEAQLIKNMLESNGISCILVRQVPSSVYPFTVDGLAEVRILVKEEDASFAKKLLEIKEEEKK